MYDRDDGNCGVYNRHGVGMAFVVYSGLCVLYAWCRQGVCSSVHTIGAWTHKDTHERNRMRKGDWLAGFPLVDVSGRSHASSDSC